MKIVYSLLSLSLVWCALIPYANATAAATTPPLTAYRDPGTGPVVPWPLDFSRDTLFDSEFLGTWKTGTAQGENPWSLTLARAADPGVYTWSLSTAANPTDTISGTGRIDNNILVGYWYSGVGGFGTITVHMLSGKVYLKMGFSKERVLEQTFERRESPVSIQ